MFFTLAFFLVALLAAIAHGSSNLATDSIGNRSILIFGDSNTWGFNPERKKGDSGRFPIDERWTTIVKVLLENKFNIISEGLNGRTTIFKDENNSRLSGRDALPNVLQKCQALKLIVLALGTNDINIKYKTNVSDVVRGIQTLVDDIKTSKAYGNNLPPAILVLGGPILYSTKTSLKWGFPDKSTDMSKEASDMLVKACQDMKVNYLNLGKGRLIYVMMLISI
jgi:lysophospholipase L1-like esterase